MEWITKIDIGILKGFFSLAEKSGDTLTPFAKFMTAVGEKGWPFLVLAVVLAIFPKTRKIGVCVFGAIACSFLLSNLILKDWIARPRPFAAGGDVLHWWYVAGHVYEEGFSCPSGHVASAMAGVTALWFMRDRKSKRNKLWLALYVIPAVMFFARCYLMAHHPSDCLFGLLVGWCSAFASWFVTEFIWILMENHKDSTFSKFCMNVNFAVFVKDWIRITLENEKNRKASKPTEKPQS